MCWEWCCLLLESWEETWSWVFCYSNGRLTESNYVTAGVWLGERVTPVLWYVDWATTPSPLLPPNLLVSSQKQHWTVSPPEMEGQIISYGRKTTLERVWTNSNLRKSVSHLVSVLSGQLYSLGVKRVEMIKTNTRWTREEHYDEAGGGGVLTVMFCRYVEV